MKLSENVTEDNKQLQPLYPVNDSARVAAVQMHVAKIVRAIFVSEFMSAKEELLGFGVVGLDFQRVPADCIECARVVVLSSLPKLFQRQSHVCLRSMTLT